MHWSHLKCPIAYVANGYCTGQCRFGTFPASQKVLLNTAALNSGQPQILTWGLSKITNGECLWSRTLSPRSQKPSEQSTLFSKRQLQKMGAGGRAGTEKGLRGVTD